MAVAVKIGLSAEEGNMLQCSLCLTVYKERLKECPHCAVRRKNEFKWPKKKKVKTYPVPMSCRISASDNRSTRFDF